jgi:ABC-2 type transport system ATP-binding protein
VAAIRARGVTKRFETTLALDAVNLEVSEGEIRGLLGPNGAGKTTLLRILFGLITPDGGSVELFDRPSADVRHPRLEGVAGFVEDPSFYPYLSGQANLDLLARLDDDGGSERIAEVLERVGLGDRGEDRVNGYSSGMKQRLGIAAALLRAPRLLLLDEPTAGLDPAGVREMGGLVQELSAAGVAILLSSHQIVEVEDVCHTFSFLRQGEVVWDGTATELRAQAPASSYAMSTSDDQRALELADRTAGISAERTETDGLTLSAAPDAMDRYVLALGQAGVPVRRLELRVSPLESMFFELTGDPR